MARSVRWKRRRYFLALAIVAHVGCIAALARCHRWQLRFSIQQIYTGRRLSGEADRDTASQVRHQIPLRPWLDPPSPIISGKAWNASDIRWVGNSFYFQSRDGSDIDNNFHLYTPHQIQKAFRHHSILLHGDSTVRRLYGTMHGILSADIWTGSTSMDFPKGFPSQVPHPPFGIPATYFARRGLENQAKGQMDSSTLLSYHMHSPIPIDYRLLEHRTILDVNKDFYTEPCERTLPASYVMMTPGTLPDDIETARFEYKVCRPHPTGGWLPPNPLDRKGSSLSQNFSPERPLLYDFINTNCVGNIHDFVTHELDNEQSITRQHSVYIVGPGVWETVKQNACRHPLFEQTPDGQLRGLDWPYTIYQLQQETLEKMAMLVEQTPELIVIWRTSGHYDGDVNGLIIQEMNKRAVDFIHDWNTKLNSGSKSNFLCLDFGSAIEHRSQGRSRLRGDMQAHYGLEARVLQVQMITNLLFEHGHVP